MAVMESWRSMVGRLDGVGAWLSPLGLRALLAWEFFESGREKLYGQNWFGDIQAQFPLPFRYVPADFSWGLATWFELLGGLALLIGLGTRFVAYSLFVLTIVATAAVHWPQDWMNLSQLAHGYAISDMGHGNFKLPVIFLVMLLPLILCGGGRFSLDAAIGRFLTPSRHVPVNDRIGWGLVLMLIGLPMAMLLPLPGLVAATVGAVLLLWEWWRRRLDAVRGEPTR